VNYSHGSAARNGEGAKIDVSTTEILLAFAQAVIMLLCPQLTTIPGEWGNYYTYQHVSQYLYIGLIKMLIVAVCFTRKGKDPKCQENGRDLILSHL
jgi:hypothetical protein